jgi:hypothetical protein
MRLSNEFTCGWDRWSCRLRSCGCASEHGNTPLLIIRRSGRIHYFSLTFVSGGGKKKIGREVKERKKKVALEPPFLGASCWNAQLEQRAADTQLKGRPLRCNDEY